jgi:hypothetical protein
LWGCVKDEVYTTEVTGAEGVKTLIKDVITTINGGMLARAGEELDFKWMFSVRHGVPTFNCAEFIRNFMHVSIKYDQFYTFAGNL